MSLVFPRQPLLECSQRGEDLCTQEYEMPLAHFLLGASRGGRLLLGVTMLVAYLKRGQQEKSTRTAPWQSKR